MIDELSDDIPTGIYFGWAKLNNDPVEKMVMSIGWNPYYKNERKSMVRESRISLVGRIDESHALRRKYCSMSLESFSTRDLVSTIVYGTTFFAYDRTGITGVPG